MFVPQENFRAQDGLDEFRREAAGRKWDFFSGEVFRAPEVVEIGGVRYCFLTCYDFYFVEQWAAIARVGPDVIIG